jgi:hypothetical protein
MPRGIVDRLLCVLVFAALPATGWAYSGGTPGYVTDVAPFCASCHSSVSEAQLAGVPAQRIQQEQVASKHVALIRAAREGSPYAALTDQQREALIAAIQKIDAASQVQVIAPALVKAGSVVEVTVKATGGGGPVAGLALVDSGQRWQARPAPSAGWLIIDKPRVLGPDGQPQTKFTDGRNSNLAPGISYVNVYGLRADPAQDRFDSVSATFRLRAPALPGTYPLAAVFLYGTEKHAPHGGVQTMEGMNPLGGFAGSGGRVAFSSVLQIKVE